VADALGQDPGNLSRILAGKRHPSQSLLIRLEQFVVD
jgi:transcriptional regulator with XRE-family HTH domain